MQLQDNWVVSLAPWMDLFWVVVFCREILHGQIIGLPYIIFIILLQLSLSYTRKRFSDAIVGEDNRSYINTVAKRGINVNWWCVCDFGCNSVVID